MRARARSARQRGPLLPPGRNGARLTRAARSAELVREEATVGVKRAANRRERPPTAKGHAAGLLPAGEHKPPAPTPKLSLTTRHTEELVAATDLLLKNISLSLSTRQTSQKPDGKGKRHRRKKKNSRSHEAIRTTAQSEAIKRLYKMDGHKHQYARTARTHFTSRNEKLVPITTVCQ